MSKSNGHQYDYEKPNQILNFVFKRPTSGYSMEEGADRSRSRASRVSAASRVTIASQPSIESLSDEEEGYHYSVAVIVSVHKKKFWTNMKDTCTGVRYLQVFLCFLLLFIAYGMRVNLSVGIVAMTSREATKNPDVPVYPHWKTKSVLQSSFFWGYVIPQVMAGQLAKKYGPKWFLVVCMSLCSFFAIVLPVMTSTLETKGVMICRTLQGLSQGFIFPSVHHLMGKWVPVNERSRVGCIIYAGGSFGTVVSMITSGLLASTWWGWPSIFYVYGCVGLLWSVLMALYGSNSPAEHKSISQEERAYIESSIEGEADDLATPWCRIITSVPVWALLITHMGQMWGFWTLMTEIPTFMEKILEFDIRVNSYLSALPYFTLWLTSFVFGGLADMLIIKRVTTVGGARKICNSIGLVIPAIALVSLGYCDKDNQNMAVGLLVVAVGVNSAIYCGFHVNHMDLSPNHSGTLMGITNTISNCCSFAAPLFVHFIVTNESDQSQWKIVFFTTAGIYIVTNTVFVVFGSGEVQPWNDEIRKVQLNNNGNAKPGNATSSAKPGNLKLGSDKPPAKPQAKP